MCFTRSNTLHCSTGPRGVGKLYHSALFQLGNFSNMYKNMPKIAFLAVLCFLAFDLSKGMPDDKESTPLKEKGMLNKIIASIIFRGQRSVSVSKR